MSPAHVKTWLFSREPEHVDCSRGILLQRKGLHDHVIVAVGRLLEIDELVDNLLNLEQIGISLFADFTLESFPVHTDQILRFLLLHLGCKPALQTLEVNEAYRT